MFHDLTITNVAPQGQNAVSLSFDVPAHLRATFRWQAGQYLTLRAEVNGQDIRRPYSIAALPGGALSVGIKKIAGGAFSTYAQGLKPGDHMQVMPPEGRFLRGQARRIVLIAAGSGVTPMVSLAGAALADGGEVALIYGNKGVGDIMFRGALDALKDLYTDRFALIHVLSRDPQDVALLNGRITGAKVLALAAAGAVDLAGAEGVFLCGPGGMIDDVSTALDGVVASSLIHTERFHADAAGATKVERASIEQPTDQGDVEVRLDGTVRRFAMRPGDASVLDAAARQGLELPYSCRGGMCCTCRCRIVEGQATMAVNYSLEPWEIAAGFTLACQARPTTDRLVLDFDAV